MPGFSRAAPSNTAAPAEPAAQATTAALDAPIGIKPGRWENTYEMLDVQAKDMPAQVVAAMKGQPQKITTCVTPEQAKAGVRELMQANGGKCTFDKYEFGSGKIATALSCDMPNGKMVSKSTGTYTDTSYEAVGEGTMSGPMTMTIKSRSSGQWVGECTGEEKAK